MTSMLSKFQNGINLYEERVGGDDESNAVVLLLWVTVMGPMLTGCWGQQNPGLLMANGRDNGGVTAVKAVGSLCAVNGPIEKSSASILIIQPLYLGRTRPRCPPTGAQPTPRQFIFLSQWWPKFDSQRPREQVWDLQLWIAFKSSVD